MQGRDYVGNGQIVSNEKLESSSWLRKISILTAVKIYSITTHSLLFVLVSELFSTHLARKAFGENRVGEGASNVRKFVSLSTNHHSFSVFASHFQRSKFWARHAAPPHEYMCATIFKAPRHGLTDPSLINFVHPLDT